MKNVSEENIEELVFRYLEGDMAGEELSGFESRLQESDQLQSLVSDWQNTFIEDPQMQFDGMESLLSDNIANTVASSATTSQAVQKGLAWGTRQWLSTLVLVAGASFIIGYNMAPERGVANVPPVVEQKVEAPVVTIDNEKSSDTKVVEVPTKVEAPVEHKRVEVATETVAQKEEQQTENRNRLETQLIPVAKRTEYNVQLDSTLETKLSLTTSSSPAMGEKSDKKGGVKLPDLKPGKLEEVKNSKQIIPANDDGF